MSWPSFVNISEPLTRTPAPEVGEITVAMFQRALWIAQSLTANTMGNSLSALFYNQPGNPNALNEVLVSIRIFQQGKKDLIPLNSKTI